MKHVEQKSTVEIGQLVRAERKRQDLTQLQLAGLAGTGLRFISDLENRRSSAASSNSGGPYPARSSAPSPAPELEKKSSATQSLAKSPPGGKNFQPPSTKRNQTTLRASTAISSRASTPAFAQLEQ